MIDKLNSIRENFQNMSKDITDLKSLNDLKIQFLGKKGKVQSLFKEMKNLPNQEKKEFGGRINTLKNEISEFFKTKKNELEKKAIKEKLKNEWIDVTLPYNKLTNEKGGLSPISLIQEEIMEIFKSMGFSIFDGPQVEDDFHNFTALNIPETHPARDMQDTFWLKNKQLLRTHTSSVQIRAMEKFKPPMKGIGPGRVFRYEALDASHENTFYQVEGLMVDKNISVSHLIYFMKTLLSEIFEKEVNVRLRPGFFPFVEPGFELDIECLICGGKGCSVCKNTGWVELLPCGLVHPNVLIEGGINPDKWSGFAFGLGLNRLAMMKYGINDIRWFESGDLRFNNQFK